MAEVAGASADVVVGRGGGAVEAVEVVEVWVVEEGVSLWELVRQHLVVVKSLCRLPVSIPVGAVFFRVVGLRSK